VLEAVQSGPGKSVAPLSTASGLDSVITGGIWSLVLAAVLGATITSGEFRHSSATLTYLATPNRNKVLSAKMAAGALVGVVFGVIGYVVALATGLIFIAARHESVGITDVTLIRYGLGHLLACALLAAIGVGLGALIRSQLAVVIGVFVWTIVAESLLGGLYKSAAPYLPYTAATTLAGSSLGGAAFGPAHDAATSAAPLPFAAAAGLVAGVAIVVAAVAARTTVPRDIS
jgi:ABC-type transport system involved in multi-copper enzyme maturation permease subunit